MKIVKNVEEKIELVKEVNLEQVIPKTQVKVNELHDLQSALLASATFDPRKSCDLLAL